MVIIQQISTIVNSNNDVIKAVINGSNYTTSKLLKGKCNKW